jgi:hypothetical protein
VAGSAFYGMMAYAVTVTAVLGMFGIRVGKRFFYRRRAGRIPPRENTAPMPLPALEGGQQEIDLVPEQRAPPEPLEEAPFGDIMMRVLGRSLSTNPFLYN